MEEVGVIITYLLDLIHCIPEETRATGGGGGVIMGRDYFQETWLPNS